MQMFSTKKIGQLLTYPFKEADSGKKILIGSLLVLAGYIIPIIPILFVLGYSAKIAKRIIDGDGKLVLPEWDDWGDLFKSGGRLLGVSLVYSLPIILIFSIGFIAYFVSFVPLMMSDNYNNFNSFTAFVPFFSFMILMVTMVIGMFLSLVEGIFLPVIMMHVVHKETFKSGFDFKGWWKAFRNNFAGFFVAFIILFGLYYLVYMIILLTAYSMIFAIAVPFISAFITFYMSLISMPLIAQAYYEGCDHLITKQEEL